MLWNDQTARLGSQTAVICCNIYEQNFIHDILTRDAEIPGISTEFEFVNNPKLP